tara:strand:+ start:77907 stop:78371 length:465 start_codon:yes stop_codon:yes gene_type:complete
MTSLNLNKFGILLFAIFSLGLFSCNKTTDEIVADVTPTMSAKVGGVAWTTKIAAGVNSTLFVITGTKDKEAIILSIPTKDVGVYAIDGINNNASYLPILDSLSSAYVAYSGSIEIKDLNFSRTQFNGTFEFTAINSSLDTIHVTEGVMKNIPTK